MQPIDQNLHLFRHIGIGYHNGVPLIVVFDARSAISRIDGSSLLASALSMCGGIIQWIGLRLLIMAMTPLLPRNQTQIRGVDVNSGMERNCQKHRIGTCHDNKARAPKICPGLGVIRTKQHRRWSHLRCASHCEIAHIASPRPAGMVHEQVTTSSRQLSLTSFRKSCSEAIVATQLTGKSELPRLPV